MAKKPPVCNKPRIAKKLSQKKPLPPAPASAWNESVPEDERGLRFFEKLRLWQFFHDDRGQTIFTKAKLEKLVHDDHKEREEWFKRQLEAAISPAAKKEVRKQQAREKEARRRDIERGVVALQEMQVPIHDVDARGRVVNRDSRPQKDKNKQFTERAWRYDPNGVWSRRIDELFDTYGIQVYDLVGIMACRTLLTDLQGLPQLEGARGLVDKMTALLSKEIREEAIELSRAWRYSLGDTSKYASPAKKQALGRWYNATILRQQVEIEHTSPGKPSRVRRLAALGTTFDREENAVYLLGSEEDSENPGNWKWPVQWKFDRVSSVTPVGLKNPPLSAIWNHPRVRAARGPGPERLDISHLYSDSVGAFFRYGQPTIRLELLVHAPHWIAWCLEKPFHPNQRPSHETNADGKPQLRLVVDRCDEAEIASRLLRLGGNFTVVSPPSLIEKLKATATAIAERHS